MAAIRPLRAVPGPLVRQSTKRTHSRGFRRGSRGGGQVPEDWSFGGAARLFPKEQLTPLQIILALV